MADDKQNYTKTGIDQSHDIVTRLRHAAVGLPQDDMNQTAADEIVRLRAAGDALVESLDHSRADIRSAVAAWEEARRG